MTVGILLVSCVGKERLCLYVMLLDCLSCPCVVLWRDGLLYLYAVLSWLEHGVEDPLEFPGIVIARSYFNFEPALGCWSSEHDGERRHNWVVCSVLFRFESLSHSCLAD